MESPFLGSRPSPATAVPGPEEQDREWARRIADKLDVHMLGFPVLAYRTVSSTSDVLKHLASNGAPEGLSVIAREQTKGRGQQGRRWLSTRGKGVYLSVLLKPRWTGSEVKWLALLAGEATARALNALGVAGVTLKWPNDVLAEGKKIAGVLSEPRMGRSRLLFAVVGIGINVGHAAEDWPADLAAMATSCRLQGLAVSCDDVIAAVLTHLDAVYTQVRSGGPGFLLEAWKQKGSIPPFARKRGTPAHGKVVQDE